jgi:hypothetical protein
MQETTMRNIARYYSILLAVVLLAAMTTSVPTMIREGLPVVLRMSAGLLIAIPLCLAGIVLGPKGHRWERYALLSNQLLSVFSALALAWTDFVPGARAGVFAMVLMAAVLNWSAMAERVRTKLVLIGVFGVWALAFLFIASSLDTDAKRGLMAAVAGANAFAFYVLTALVAVGVVTFCDIKLRGIAPKEKNDPLSKAFRQGDLAFRNALGEEMNPYADRDQKLSKAWISGYRKAAAAAKHRNVHCS